MHTKQVVRSPSQMQNLVNLFSNGQNSFAYLICNGWPPEKLKHQRTFLEISKKKVKEWHHLSQSPSGEYQTSPNSMMLFRTADGFIEAKIELLGTYSSSVYPNSDLEEPKATNEEDSEGSHD